MKFPNIQNKLSDADVLRFSDLVRAKSGLEIPAVRRVDLENAILHTLKSLALADTDDLFRFLKNGAEGIAPLESLIALVTVGETHFFRNRPQFEALENHILPELIKKNRSSRSLRVWSAGCASGEEAYSLAIMIKRLLPDIADWNIHILATDINRTALEKAHLGHYGSRSFREVPIEIQTNYFDRTGPHFDLSPAIIKMVSFEYLNLVEDLYPSMLTNTQGVDLILCRNVLIYFNESTQRKVVERLYGCLVKDGWLVVGHSEPSQSIFHQFSVVNFPGAVIYRKSTLPQTKVPAPTAAREVPRPIPPEMFTAPVRQKEPLRLKALPSVDTARRLVNMPLLVSEGIQNILLLIENKQFDQAESALIALAPQNPVDPWQPYLLAKVYASQLEYEKALVRTRVLIENYPLLAPAHYLNGLILSEVGQIEASLEAFRACVYSDPDFVLGHFAMAGILERLMQPGRALRAYENVNNLLANKEPAELVPEGDGLTVGRLLEFTSAQKELLN